MSRYEPRITGHALRVERPLAPVSEQRWYCECGAWEGHAPARGPFNSTSSKARLGVVITAHGRHLSALRRRLEKAEKAAA